MNNVITGGVLVIIIILAYNYWKKIKLHSSTIKILSNIALEQKTLIFNLNRRVTNLEHVGEKHSTNLDQISELNGLLRSRLVELSS